MSSSDPIGTPSNTNPAADKPTTTDSTAPTTDTTAPTTTPGATDTTLTTSVDSATSANAANAEQVATAEQPGNAEQPSVAQSSALKGINPLVWVLVVIVAILLLAVGFLLGERSKNTAQAPAHNPAATTSAHSAKPGKQFSNGSGDSHLFGGSGEVTSQEDILKIHRRSAQDPFAVGAVDAPVVITEFSDFECPFCSRHHNATEPVLMKKYVEAGLVRIEWNDFPVNGPNAVAAAKAGRAAAAQGKFAEFKKALYTDSKNTSGHPNYGTADFVKFAKTAGVPDLERFEKEATDDTYTQTVTKAREYAAALGINATPSFVIGDAYITGAQPIDVFEKIINEQLKKAAA